MHSFSFIGLGLNDEKGMTLDGLEEARRARIVFAEFYTNPMPNLNLERLESQIGKKIRLLTRTQLEEEGGRELITAGREGSAALLVPGDPMIATTHVTLRLALSTVGIKSRIIHSASVISAICGATGLQSYKFGKAITIPFDDPLPRSILDTVSDNRSRGLHTLLLLDVRAGQDRQLTIPEALRKIVNARLEVQDLVAVGVARLGASDEQIKAAKIRELVDIDFGNPSHSIVVVGSLHFMETEALKAFCGLIDNEIVEDS